MCNRRGAAGPGREPRHVCSKACMGGQPRCAAGSAHGGARKCEAANCCALVVAGGSDDAGSVGAVAVRVVIVLVLGGARGRVGLVERLQRGKGPSGLGWAVVTNTPCQQGVPLPHRLCAGDAWQACTQ